MGLPHDVDMVFVEQRVQLKGAQTYSMGAQGGRDPSSSTGEKPILLSSLELMASGPSACFCAAQHP